MVFQGGRGFTTNGTNRRKRPRTGARGTRSEEDSPRTARTRSFGTHTNPRISHGGHVANFVGAGRHGGHGEGIEKGW